MCFLLNQNVFCFILEHFLRHRNIEKERKTRKRRRPNESTNGGTDSSQDNQENGDADNYGECEEKDDTETAACI